MKYATNFLFCGFFIMQSCKENPSQVKNTAGAWIKVKSDVTNTLYDIDFVDDQNGWVVGDSSIILCSTNGGESWKRQICPIEDCLRAVDFLDNKNGWICSRNSILRTTNGGESWEIKYSEDLGEGRFRDIKFLNYNIGFVVGGKGSYGNIGVLLMTDDDGETWRYISNLHILPTLTHVSTDDDQSIWICGFGGTILSTSDIGKTWTYHDLKVSPSPSLTQIQFVDRYHGWTSSRDDYLGFYMTADGGNNWSRISNDSFRIIGGVLSSYFIDKNTGWMCNFPFDRILKTIDSGLTWEFDTEIRQRINSFVFKRRGLGWAIGNNGNILKNYEINNIY